MKTQENDPEDWFFMDLSGEELRSFNKEMFQEPSLPHTRHLHENIGRNRPEPWFTFGNWKVVSDEDLMEQYGNGISHNDGLPS